MNDRCLRNSILAGGLAAALALACGPDAPDDLGPAVGPPGVEDGGPPADAGIEQGPPDAGPAPRVSYAEDIQPIWDARCASCHSWMAPDHSYGQLLTASTGCERDGKFELLPLVVPGDPGRSALWIKLHVYPTQDVPALHCYRPMPATGSTLKELAPGDFALIEQWIAQGAADD